TRESASFWRASLYMRCTVVRAIFICSAHCSWVKPCKSMSLMVSYSSTDMTTQFSGLIGRFSGPKLSLAGMQQTFLHFLGRATLNHLLTNRATAPGQTLQTLV